MAQHVEQGNAEIAKAEKKLKSFSLFGNKHDDALEMFEKAATYYKLGQAWQQAGETFNRIAQMHLKSGSKHEAAQAYGNATTAFKKCNTKDAIEAEKACIEINLDQGRFTTAAKHHKEVGEMYEADGDLENAREHFDAAARYYQTEESTSSANQCLLKVAQFSAEIEEFQRAADIFEQVANSSLEVALLKWSVKDYFFNAMLCHMAIGDQVACRRALEMYMDKDINFPDTQECKLLQGCVQAMEDEDVEAYTQAVFDFDQIKKLDKWRTSMLLKTKKKMSAGGGLL